VTQSTNNIRCYFIDELLDALGMDRRTFERHRKKGLLPFLEELQPRIGRKARYRADLIDRYFDNAFVRGARVNR